MGQRTRYLAAALHVQFSVYFHVHPTDEAPVHLTPIGGPMLENLLDSINEVRAKKPITCTVGKFLTGLDPADQERLNRVLDDESITSVEISQALRGTLNVAPGTVARHRRRADGSGCGCPQ